MGITFNLPIGKFVFPLVLIGILLFSLSIRLALSDHGLPKLQVGDENSDLSTALQLTEGELPQWHVRYHRSLIAYTDASAVAGLLGVKVLRGELQTLQDFRDLYFEERWLFTLATRIMMNLLTTGAILFTALAGRYIEKSVGLFAALILALNGFFLVNSIFALPDGLVMFSVAFALWLTMRMLAIQRGKDYFLAGLGIALVMLSKFSATVIAISVLSAHVAITWNVEKEISSAFLRRLVLDHRLLALAAGVLIGNIAFNPLGFIYPQDLAREIARMSNYAYGGQTSAAVQFQIIGQHLKQMVSFAWRWTLPLTLLGAVSAYRYRHCPAYWIVVLAFGALFISISRITTSYYKLFFWTPWLIPSALLSAIGIRTLVTMLSSRWRLAGYLAGYLLVFTLLALEGSFTTHIIAIVEQRDTRELALTYIEQHIPSGTAIMSGQPLAYSVPIERTENSIRRAVALGKDMLNSWQWQLDHPSNAEQMPRYDLYGPELHVVIDTYDDLAELVSARKIEVVVETDYCVGSINDPESSSSIEYPALNDTLRNQWELLKEFSPFNVHECRGGIDDRTGLTFDRDALKDQIRTGPIIRIYRVNPD